jgi:hypothetical protein
MDLLTFLSTYSDVGFGSIVVAVVVLIITGRLVPITTHRRELDRERSRGDEWKDAHSLSEQGRKSALEQNGALLAGVRIADKFYRDFLPPVPDEHTIPHMTGGSDVAVH